jgi:hypothetical protein
MGQVLLHFSTPFMVILKKRHWPPRANLKKPALNSELYIILLIYNMF